VINEYRRKIAIGPVRDTSGGDTFQKLCGRKLSC